MTLSQDHLATIRNYLGGNTENQNDAHDEPNTDIPRLTHESRSGRRSASQLNGYACGQMYVHTARNTIEVQTQTPAQRNLIGRIMTAPPPVSSPSSILQPSSSHCALIFTRENTASF